MCQEPPTPPLFCKTSLVVWPISVCTVSLTAVAEPGGGGRWGGGDISKHAFLV